MVGAPSIPLGPREQGEQINEDNRERNRAKDKVNRHWVAFLRIDTALPVMCVKPRGDLSVPA
jgi:hypothetical protein